MIKKIVLSVTMIVALLLVAATVYLYRPLASNPDAETLSAAAANYRAEIIRDSWGVPHIYGKRDADVAFGLAYAHAEDDFATIQETVAATRGVMARYRGADAAPIDYIVQFMGVWQTLESKRAALPKDVVTLAQAYADGINLYAAEHPKLSWSGLAPFSADDVIVGFMFKTPFFYSFDKTLKGLFDENYKSEIALMSDSRAQAWTSRAGHTRDLGSNALAVSAKRSADNKTRLLINSHQPMTGPVAWYEAHLVSEEGWDITGGLFPGTPLILHGFNKNLAWANTVNHIDLVDTYVLTVNPDKPTQYWLDGEWQNFEEREVSLEVKLFGDFRFPVKRKILRSEHGPVVVNGDEYIAVRYAGMGEVRQLEQYYRLNKARDFNDFFAAMAMNALPSINYVYADQDSNIAFIHNAQYPKRDGAWNWQKDLPGDRSELIWKEYRAFSEIPQLINPESGLLFNANNTPFLATDGADNLRKQDFPPSMGLAEDNTNRAYRFAELNDGESKLSKLDVLQQKFDITYSKQSEYYQILEKVMAEKWNEPHLIDAQQRIQAWDRKANIENRGTALPITILRQIIRSDNPDDHSPATLKLATEQAIEFLLEQYGRLDPSWGELNRLKRGDYNQAVSGGPDLLRAIYSMDAERVDLYATHGDTWMALVEWDADGQQQASVLHQFGTATLDQNSPHYNDQAPLFVSQQWRTALLTRDVIEQSASRRYTIGGLE